MYLQKRLSSLLNYSLLFLISVISLSAQVRSQPAGPNYEATLHVLVASNQASTGTDLPQSLSTVSRQVRSEFGSSNLRLLHTHLGRMSNDGTLEYKGVSNAYTPDPQPGSPAFLEWTLHRLKASETGAVQDRYQFESFRFGARVPVRVVFSQDQKAPAPINYESIGLTLTRLNVRENVPTLVGTLTQPKTAGTLFLVLTVRNVDK